MTTATVNVGLDESYRLCRAVNREHGRTYYLAAVTRRRFKATRLKP